MQGLFHVLGRSKLEDLFHSLTNAATGSFHNFPGSLTRAYTNIFCAFACANTHIFSGTNRMQGNKVASTFAHAFRGLSCPLASTFADVASTTADIAAGASSLLRLWLRRLLIVISRCLLLPLHK